MQRHPLGALMVSSKKRPCRKRPAETWEENYSVFKKARSNLLICPVERKSSLLPKNRNCNSSSIDTPVTSSHSCSTTERFPVHQFKKTLTSSKGYNPFDFTSDELNPACEWLRNTSSGGKYGADIIELLRDILAPFPLGLRLNKLEAMIWDKYKIQLTKLSLDQGYKNSLQLLETLPEIILKFRKRPFRCLVQLDPDTYRLSHQTVTSRKKR